MDLYMKVLGWTLKHRWSAVVASCLALALTAVMFMVLPTTFQPDRDRDTTTARVEMVPGTTLAETDAVVQRVATILHRQPQIEPGTIYTRSSVGSGRVTADFVDHKGMTSTQFERKLTPVLAQIPDARINFNSGAGWGGSGRDLTVTLGGDDPKLLTQTARKVVDAMGTLSSVVGPRITGGLERPEIVIRPRLDLAANLGVTTAALSNAIRVATLGDIDQNSAKFSLSDRQVPIRVALAQTSRERLSTIQNLPVATQTGGSVPLGLVAQIGFGAGPTQIDRVNQQRQLTIGADLAPGVVSGTAMAQIHALPIMKNLPIGVNELTLGQAKWQAEMINNFIVAVLAGVFLVFAVLVLLYRRALPPFVNMSSLMLAPLGGLLALWVTGNAVSMPVFIGLLMLLGIVAKNSILLIDFALEEMAKGVDTLTATLDAGHKRAQPIVMTTVAMVAGMVPTALSLSGDPSSRTPMGITVIGGLTLSTILTLVIVPALFSLSVGIERRIGPRLARRLLSYRPGDEERVIENRPGPGRIGYDDEEPHPAE